jgi:hypothetical protein
MKDSNYSLSGIHLPARHTLVRRLKKASFIINDSILCISAVFLVGSIVHFRLFENVLGGFLKISPLIILLFMLAGIILLFSAKELVSNQQSKKKHVLKSLVGLIPVFCSGIVLLVGFINIFRMDFNGNVLIDGSQITPLIGFNFYLIGFALIFPYVKFTHRFHFSQLLLFIVIMLNSVTILCYMYQNLSPFIVRQNLIPLNVAMLTALFCIGVLLRWSNRGFFGSFTNDSFSSLFALRLLLINAVVTPIIGFITLLITKHGFYNNDVYQQVALVVVMVVMTSTVLAWFNIKALYQFELEHFVMKETLRIHNIDLKSDVNDKEEEVEVLEITKQKYLDALNHEDALKNLTERLS